MTKTTTDKPLHNPEVMARASLLEAIREHRASHTPAAWSVADRRLYDHLPELHASRVMGEALAEERMKDEGAT